MATPPFAGVLGMCGLGTVAAVLAICGLVGCQPSDSASSDDFSWNYDINTAFAGLSPVEMKWPGGFRSLVGVPTYTKALVAQDGTIGPQTALKPQPKERAIRLQIRPGGAAISWELETQFGESPVALLRAEIDGAPWHVSVEGVRVESTLGECVSLQYGGAQSGVVEFGFNVDETLTWDGRVLSARDRALLVAWSDAQPACAVVDTALRCELPGTMPGEATTLTHWLVPRDSTVESAGGLEFPSVESARDSVRAEWRALLEPAAQFDLPDAHVETLYRASLANLILLRDRVGDLFVAKPGALEYNTFWMRDAAYVAHTFDLVGLHEQAEETLRMFWRGRLPDSIHFMGTWDSTTSQKDNGSWEAPNDEWDGTGQILWALWGHFLLTNDEEWLAQVYPSALRAGDWLQSSRQANLDAADVGQPHFGLLAAGHGESLVESGYVLYHNYWGVLGAESASALARWAGDDTAATRFAVLHQEFRESVRAAVSQAYIPLEGGGGEIPSAHGVEGGRLWGTIAALFPCRVLDAQNSMLTDTFEVMWQNRTWDLYTFENWKDKVWTYINAEWGQALLRRGEWDRAWILFRGFIDAADANLSWWEEHWVSSGQGTGDNPHGWAAAEMVAWLRDMFVSESHSDSDSDSDSDSASEPESLHLLRGIPGEWFVPREPLVAKGIPTAFGRSDELRATTDEAGVTVVEWSWTPLDGRTLSHVVVHRRGLSNAVVSCNAEFSSDGNQVLIPSPPTQLSCTFAPP